MLAKKAILGKTRDMAAPPANTVTRFPTDQMPVSFHRLELNTIMSIYGRMVARGEWRDYGISMLREVAIFSIFRHASEMPMYRIEKQPKLAGRQGMYSIKAMNGQVLGRGQELAQVLRVLEKKLIKIVR